jgi:hypothetical protein
MLFGTINRLNKMTELVVQLQQQQQILGLQFQRFYVGWGNNDPIVRQVVKSRPWWQQSNNEDFSEVAFLWTAWKKQTHIDYLYGASKKTKGGVSLDNTIIGDFQPIPNGGVPHQPDSSDIGTGRPSMDNHLSHPDI